MMVIGSNKILFGDSSLMDKVISAQLVFELPRNY
jgi:hypothetical protein